VRLREPGADANADGTATGADAGFHPVAEVVEPLDPAPYLAILEERFGIPPHRFDRYLIFRPNAKRLAIVDRQLRVPAGVEPLAIGMPFFYVNMRDPRWTTAAAVAFGHLATRNLIELDDRELTAFLTRRDLPLRPEEAARCTGPGYVLARHRGMVVGMGRAWEAEEGGLVVRGTVPRSWPARLGL